MNTENPEILGSRRGWVEVICGSMFSGKTEELIRRMNRACIAKQTVEIFKPAVDTRYAEESVVSHDATAVKSTPVDAAESILLYVGNDVNVVGIDEAQFFGDELIGVCTTLANRGIRVIVAGLDMDYLGQPFGPMPKLMAIAEYVAKVHAICMICGNPAQFSHRTADNNKLVMLGETESYQPLCRECYNKLTGLRL
ncbi:MAG: thymidine kinase [Bacteroidales bacterium]|nr:thymidine kinase [Bacteroidales bacterium]